MPMYEFACATCGPFTQQRRLHEAGEPMPCPQCQTIATRIYSTAGIMRTSGSVRRRFERGAEPRVVTRSAALAPSSGTPYQSSSGRPWQLGHAAATGPVPANAQRL